jgi:acetyltransferase
MEYEFFSVRRRQLLDAVFAPRSVAVIGASDRPKSVGHSLLQNLSSFPRPIYPVNPKHEMLGDVRCYPSLASLPETVDLALIATPAATVPQLVRDCAALGVRGVVIISAGFRESGPEGLRLEQETLAPVHGGNMRIIGPNCLGLLMPHASLNASFAASQAIPGHVAFLSQSGALCTAVLDWSLQEKVGFSAFVSAGSMADVNWGDLIYYFGNDPRTRSIICYMESVGDARSFMSAAREVARAKPIIILKAGRTEAAARAAASHTGALTGSDAVLDAAFRRAGILRVASLAELFDMADVLAKQPPPPGPQLAFVTNAGGAGALATDTLVTAQGTLAELSPDTIQKLNALLPAHWSHGNPVDILGDADAARYAQAVHIVAQDPCAHGLCVVLTPQAMTEATATARSLADWKRPPGKPLLASWMGGDSVQAGRDILNAAGIPVFDSPETAARAFSLMWRYSENQRALYETPALDATAHDEASARAKAEGLVQTARQTNRVLLTEAEAKQVLADYGIPVVQTRVAASVEEAVQHAVDIGFPVAVKLHSHTITHKSDVGGVQLHITDVESVRHAWQTIQANVLKRVGPDGFQGVTVQPMLPPKGFELILGSITDAQFGPVLMFGSGGRHVEYFKDLVHGLPPLNSTLAKRMMEQTKASEILRGVRGEKPVDLEALAQLLVRFSNLVIEQPRIAEIEINPLQASSSGAWALDARIKLHPWEIKDEQIPRPAIRPYPSQYIRPWNLRDGAPVLLRPIRPEDEPMLVQFHHTLSERSVYHRYFMAAGLETRIQHERLSRLCFIDYDQDMALVAECRDPSSGQDQIIGVGRLSKLHGCNEAEFALVIGDPWHGHGLGTQLLKMLVQVGRDEGLQRITGTILAENSAMLRVATKVGFKRLPSDDSAERNVSLDL